MQSGNAIQTRQQVAVIKSMADPEAAAACSRNRDESGFVQEVETAPRSAEEADHERARESAPGRGSHNHEDLENKVFMKL